MATWLVLVYTSLVTVGRSRSITGRSHSITHRSCSITGQSRATQDACCHKEHKISLTMVNVTKKFS